MDIILYIILVYVNKVSGKYKAILNFLGNVDAKDIPIKTLYNSLLLQFTDLEWEIIVDSIENEFYWQPSICHIPA